MTDNIKFLYCCTMLGGHSAGINEDMQRPEHVADWTRAFGEYPEVGVTIKYMGLNNMNPEWFKYVKWFDVVYIHLVSIANMKPCDWIEFPRYFKKNLGNDCPKIIMQIDNEMAHMNLKDDSPVRKNIEASDMVMAITKPVIEDWLEYNPNVKYIQSPRYYKDFIDPGYTMPTESKPRKEIGMMYHTWRPPDDYMGLTPHLITASHLGMPVRIFYAYPTGTFAPHIPLQFGIKKDDTTLFPRLAGADYMREIAKCYVSIEDSYIGGSRFTSECALCKVPVVGTDHVSSTTHIFPELLTPRMSIKEKVDIIKKLVDDPIYYKEIAEKGYQRNLNHYSSKTCAERFVEAMKECHLI